MTYHHGVKGTDNDGADGAELLWAALDATAAEPDRPRNAEGLDQPALHAVDSPPYAGDMSDEWDDLRQVLAGDDPPPAADDEHEDVAGDDADEEPEAALDELAALAGQVAALTAALEQERAEREHLAAQLDRLATEFDAVLGEALDTEREQRAQLESTLRELQTSLSEGAPAYDGPERRAGSDRRTAGERRRGLAPRPLRVRRATDVVEEPSVTDVHEEDDEHVEVVADDAAPSVWKSRLHDVAGSVSAWSSDDIERLRVD